MTMLQGFLPTRSPEDIWAERITLALGGERYVLRVLPMGPNAVWKERAEAEIRGLLDGFDGIRDPKDLMAFLSRIETETALGLLRAYDREGVLPDDDWIRSNVSEGALLRAFIEVLAAAHPTAAVVVDVLARDPGGMVSLLTTALGRQPGSGTDTRPSLPGTAGPHRGSAITSPTNSSSNTSRSARRASPVTGAANGVSLSRP